MWGGPLACGGPERIRTPDLSGRAVNKLYLSDYVLARADCPYDTPILPSNCPNSLLVKIAWTRSRLNEALPSFAGGDSCREQPAQQSRGAGGGMGMYRQLCVDLVQTTARYIGCKQDLSRAVSCRLPFALR